MNNIIKSIILAVFVIIPMIGYSQSKYLTGISIDSENTDLKKIQENFPNLDEIGFFDVNLSKIDLSKLNHKINRITFYECSGDELLLTSTNNGIKTLTISNSKLKKINLTDFKKLNELKELNIIECPVSTIEFADSYYLESLVFFKTQILDFKGLRNLKNLKSLDIYQMDFDDEYDISEISELEKLVSLNVTSNFKLNPITNVKSVKSINIKSNDEKVFNTSKLENFQEISELTIHGGNLDHFPLEVNSLRKLKEISLLALPINNFPDDISDFEQLTSIDIEIFTSLNISNKIRFPKSLKEITIQAEDFDIDEFRKNYPNILVKQGQM